MKSDQTITATFRKANYTLRISQDGTGAGYTDPSVGDHPYTSGSTATVTAHPATGSVLDHWTPAGSGNTCTVTMSGDRDVRATFRRLLPDLTPTTKVNIVSVPE